jgi:hypothetical protein
MLNAYVGIASKHGLAALRVERPDTLAWASRSVGARAWPYRVAFWAVLPDQTAALISWLLARGESEDALQELCRSAREVGRILASDRPTAH